MSPVAILRLEVEFRSASCAAFGRHPILFMIEPERDRFSNRFPEIFRLRLLNPSTGIQLGQGPVGHRSSAPSDIRTA